MASALKNYVICDYCQMDKESNLIYTAKKVFAGRKIIDLLQIVTQRTLSVSIGIKICNVCASSLMSTSAFIEKTQQLIEKNLDPRKFKTTTSGPNKKEKEQNDLPEVIDLNVNTAIKDDQLEKKNPQSKKKAKEDVAVPRVSLRIASTLENQASPTKKSADANIADAGTTKKLAPATQKLATPKNKELPITSGPNKKEKEQNGLPIKVIDLNDDQLEKKNPQSKKQAKEDVPVPRVRPRKASTLENQASPTKKSADANIADGGTTKELAPATQKLATPKNKELPIDDTEEGLVGAVKLTPSNTTTKKNSIIQLFGDSETIDVNVSESEDDDPTNGIQKPKEDSKEPVPFNIKINIFKCKLCDFVSKSAKPLKEHLKSVHNQQRPRIFFCSVCPKSFGLLKTLTQHLLTHGITTQKATPKPQAKKKNEPKSTKSQTTLEPILAVLTALNEPVDLQKPVETNINPEYTFQINGKSASTPIPIDGRRKSMNFQCDLCDTEVQTVKLMQEHMTKAHHVEKPKIFKCIICDRPFRTKQNLDFHSEKHNNPESDTFQNPSNLKISETKNVQSKNSSINDKLMKSLEHNGNGEIVKQSEQTKIKIKSSPKKKSKEIEKSPIEESSYKPENDTDLNNTEMSLLSNDDESLNITVKKSPLKKPKYKPEIIIDVDNLTEITHPSNGKNSPNKTIKRKLDTSTLNSKKPKNNSITDATIKDADENLDEVNHQVKPHKKIRQESIIYAETDEGEISCNQCGKRVNSRKRLDSHIKKRHCKTLTCPTCFLESTSHLKYVKHFGNCDASNGLPCGVQKCEKTFQGDGFLISHLEKKHDYS